MKENELTRHKIKYDDCPKWVKRRLKSNLNLPARTEANNTRAKIAAQNLAAPDKKAKSQQKPASETGNAEVSKPILKVNQNKPSMIRKLVTGMYNKIKDTVQKFRFNLRSVIGKITGR